MNRLCYRVVFNKSRAMLMAVEESATCTGKGRQQGALSVATPMAAREARSTEYRFAVPVMQLAAWLCMGLTPVVYAQIVADPNAGANRPGVVQTANGLQQVNITRPSGAGVSTNAYSQFDVPRGGAILNNSPVIVATQQAGYVNGNPNLQPGGEARIIVNQVTSALPSQLRGYLEVAGQRAEVIVANPNGILVDGAGFINTSRATLTTGVPVFGGSGSLDAFRVTGGQITVQGAGLNAANVDQVDLIARAVKANAALYANRLNVVAGANQVERATLAATPIAGVGPAPATGIDVSQLGGMYANKILLASTELGVGVSTRGVLAAQAGELTLTSQGRLELAGQTNATGAMLLAARDGIDNSGTTYGAQSVRVAAGGALTNGGTMAAGQALTVTADSIGSSGTLGAGIRNDGTVDSQGDFTVSATGALSATGRNLAGGHASLQGTAVTLAGSQTQATGNLALLAKAGNLDLTGATTSAGAALRLSASGALVNDRGGLTAQGDTTITAGSVSNRGGRIVSQGATAIQSAGTVNNAAGTMESGGALMIGAASLDNTAGRAVSLNGDGLAITTTGDLTNATGTTAAGTQGGVIGGNGNVSLQAGKLANHGAINAQGDAVLRAQSLVNDAGTLAAGHNLTATISGDASNRQGAMSGATVSLNAASLDNATGRIEGDRLGIDVSGTLSNRGGAIRQFGQSDTTIRAGGLLDNTGGTLAANGANLDVSTGALANDGARIQHAGSGKLTLTSEGGASNVSGAIQTNGGLTMAAGSLNNTGGNVSAPGTVELTVRGNLGNTSGAVRAGDSLSVQAGGTLTNAGGRLESAGEHGTLSVAVASIDNTGGRIANAGDGLTRVAAQQALRNANQPGGATALIGGNGALSLTAGTLTNQGQISAKTDADLTAQALVNDSGSIAANGALTGTVAGAASNRQGTLSAQSVALTAGSLDNAVGRIEGDAMRVDISGDLSNRGGAIRQFGQTSTTVHAGGLFDNTNGTVSANGQDLGVEAGTIANGGGQILHAGNGRLAVTSQGALGNAAGSILTNGQLLAQAASLDNTAGRLSAGRDATIGVSGDLLNRQGSVYGKDGLALSAGSQLDNTSGSAQTAAGDLSVSARGTLSNAGGTVSANGASGKTTVSADSIDNAAGRIVNAGNGMTTVTARSTINNAGGTLGGNGDATVDAVDLINTAGGRIAAVGALTLSASETVNNRGGTAYGGQGLTVGGPRTRLANDGGALFGGTDVQLYLTDMTNGGGAVRANRHIGLGLPLMGTSLSGSGEMTAGGNLSLYLRGDYVNDAANRLRADGNMLVSVTGTLTNTSTLAAGGGLTAEGTSVVNASGATMTGATATVKAAGTLTNAGRIDGDTVATNSGTLTNTGTIIGNRVTVQANDISNTGSSAIIAAAQDLKVYADNSVSNLDGATIYSAGNLQIARDGTRDPNTGLLAHQVNSLINSSATIEADGDIDIAANQVTNTRTSIVTEAGTPVEARQMLTAWMAGFESSGGKAGYASSKFPQWYWSSGQAEISADMWNALRNPITVEVPKADVKYVDTGSKTLSFNKAPVDQYQGPRTCRMGDCDPPEPYLVDREIVKNPVQYYQAVEDTGSTYKITFWPDWDPAKHIRPDQVNVRFDLGVDVHDYNEVQRTVTTTTTTDRLVYASDAARIQAAGNIRMNANGGSITNYASTMAAGGVLDRRAAGGGVQDSGVLLQKTTTITGVSDYYWHQKSGGNSDLQTNVPISTTPVPPETVAALPSIQTGNQAVQTTAQNISVTSVNRVGQTVAGSGVTGGSASGTTLAGASGEAGGAAAVSASGAGRVNAADGKINRPQTLGTASGGIPNLRLPTNGLFTFRTAPGATYLVATDSRFTQYKAFISSDYMLGALNLDPQKVQKRLGDGFYEEKLIRDQVTQLTGRTFLAGYSDQLDEYKALMDNGVTYAKAFGLTPGVGLTDEQMRQLTTDMVWMVSQEVTLPDGSHQTVLVPKVYLAQGNGVDLSKTGALVAGGSVSLNASGTLENSGRIVGDIATQVLGHDIINRGTIGGDGSATVVQARQDVRNLGGRITGQDVVVSAGRDVVNETQTISSLVKLGPNGYSAGATAVGSVAEISGTGNVSVLAGRDISLTGSKVTAGSNALLGAGRDINVDTVTVGTTRDTVSRGGQSYSHDAVTRQEGSNVSAGAGLAAVAGRDMTLVNAGVKAGTDMTLVAGQDLTVAAAKDTHAHSEGSLGGKNASYTRSSYDETVRGSELKAGGNAKLAAGQTALAGAALAANGITATPGTGAGGSVALVGSSVSAGGAAADGKSGGNVAIVASKDVTIAEEREVHDASYDGRSRRSGFLSRKSSHDQTSSHADLGVGSYVDGNSVQVLAGDNLTVRQSGVAAKESVDLTAVRGDVLITAGQNTRESSALHEQSASGLSGFAGKGGIGVSVGSSSAKGSSHTLAVTQSDARSVVGATDGNVTISAGKNATIVGSDLIAGRKGDNPDAGNIDIRAENIAITTGVDRVVQDSSQNSRSTSFGMALVGTPLDTIRNLKANNESDSTVTRVKQNVGEIGHSVGTAPQVAITFGKNSSNASFHSESVTNSGSTLTGGGNITLRATSQADTNGKVLDGDILLHGSAVSAGGKAILDAKRNVNIEASTDTYSESTSSSSSGWKISTAVASPGDIGRNLNGSANNSGVSTLPFGSQKSSASGDLAVSQQNASTVTGDSVVISSRTGDVRIAGSGIAAENDTAIAAKQGRVDILSGQDTKSRRSDSSSRVIGDLGGDGYTGMTGIRTESHHLDANSTSENTIRSQIASKSGSVNIVAKDDLTARGADIAAGKDVTLIGKNVVLDPGTDDSAHNQVDKSSQYGVTLALSGYSITAAKAVESAARAMENGKDSRVAALYGAQAGLALVNGGVIGKDVLTSGGKQSSEIFKVTVSVGGGSQQSESHNKASSQQGTTITAGNAVTIVATGSGQKDADGFAADGDIRGTGVQISGKTVDLSAARDVTLESAQDRTSNNSRSSGNNFGVGVGFAFGGAQNGFTIELSAAQNKARANGESVTNENSHVSATDKLTVTSGRDTNLKGAQLIGDTIEGSVGRDLNIESRQDTEIYHSEESSSGMQASICVPPICYGTTVNASATLNSGNTDSTYSSVREQSGIYAGKGGFDVNVKGNTDLKGGILASTADPTKNRLITGTLTTSDIENKAEYSSSSSTFVASYSGGNSMRASDPNLGPVQPAHVEWGGNANLLQGAANSLAATAAGNAQKPISGSASSTTRSAIAAGTVTITDSGGQQARIGKTAEETVAGLNRDTGNANQSIDKIFDAQKVKDEQEYNRLRSEVAQQAAPLVYQKVGDVLVGASPETKAAVHALVGGLVSQAIGGSFAAGAAGGAAASLAMETFGQALLEQKDLSESDRRALVQLAGAIVGGAAGAATGGSSSDAAAGANVGKVATEYNYLNHAQKDALAKELTRCKGEATCVAKTVAKYQDTDMAQHADAQSCGDPQLCKDISMEARRGAGFSFKDAVALCGGVSSCEAYLTNLGSQNKTDEFTALRRAEQVVIAKENAVTKGTLVDGLDTTSLSGASFGTGGGAVVGVAAGRKASGPGTASGGAPQGRLGELTELFDKANPTNEITLNGRRYAATADSNKAGTTKVFDTRSLSDTQLESQARSFVGDLTGGVPLSPKGNPPTVWTTTMPDGTTVNLRSVSSSAVGASGNQARWTVDVINNPSIQSVVPRPRVEIKFQ